MLFWGPFRTGSRGRRHARLALELDDAADRLAFVHQVEPLVDALQRQLVGDQVVDVDLALHVPVDDARHVGATARAAEGRALPGAAGDELERTGRDLRAR